MRTKRPHFVRIFKNVRTGKTRPELSDPSFYDKIYGIVDRRKHRAHRADKDLPFPARSRKEGNGESGRAFRCTNLRVSPVRDDARAFERFEERLAPTADRLSRNKRKCQKTYEGIFQKNDPRDRRGGNNERRPQRCAA